MEFLGVGASELIFIILIAIIVLGPRDMQKAGKTIGRWLNQLRQSDGWKVFQQTSRELRNIPNKLMREANLELLEAEKDLRRTLDPRDTPSASQPSRRQTSLNEPGNSVQQPATKPGAEDGAGSINVQAAVPRDASLRDGGDVGDDTPPGNND